MSVVNQSSQAGGANQFHALRQQYKGKTVRLKSGGPVMTVNEVVPGPIGAMLACSWFAGKKLESAQFSPEAIEFAAPEQEAKN